MDLKGGLEFSILSGTVIVKVWSLQGGGGSYRGGGLFDYLR